MPEFVLRYKVPAELDLDNEVEGVKRQAMEIAKAVQSAVSKVFFGWEVIFEVREFGPCAGQPDFAVVG